MRWTRIVPRTNGMNADGEGVWSRRPEAGVKFRARPARACAGRRWQSSIGSPRRAVSRKTTAQGRPVVTACTCGSRARANLFCACDPGCMRPPGLPCALRLQEGPQWQAPGAASAAGRRTHVHVSDRQAGGRTLAGEPGFEPRQTESESVVLPLHHSPMGLPSNINALWVGIEAFGKPPAAGEANHPGAAWRPCTRKPFALQAGEMRCSRASVSGNLKPVRFRPSSLRCGRASRRL